MKTQKLSEMAKKNPALYNRMGKLVTDIVLEICDAKKKRDHEAQNLYESLGKQTLEAIDKDDYALFEEAVVDFEMSKIV